MDDVTIYVSLEIDSNRNHGSGRFCSLYLDFKESSIRPMGLWSALPADKLQKVPRGYDVTKALSF